MFENNKLEQLKEEHDALRHEFLSFLSEAKPKVYCQAARLIDDFVAWDIEQQTRPFSKDIVFEYQSKRERLCSVINADLKLKTYATSETELQAKRNDFRQHLKNEQQHLRLLIDDLRSKNKLSDETVKKSEELLAFRDKNQEAIIQGKLPRKQFKKYQQELSRLQDELHVLLNRDRKKAAPWLARLLYNFRKWLLDRYLNLHAHIKR